MRNTLLRNERFQIKLRENLHLRENVRNQGNKTRFVGGGWEPLI